MYQHGIYQVSNYFLRTWLRISYCKTKTPEVVSDQASLELVGLATKGGKNPSSPKARKKPTRDIYADLRRSLKDGEVCAFVGAGLSVGAGLPGWYQLISELAGQIGYKLSPAKWATGETLIDAAQAYVNAKDLYSLTNFLKDRLDTYDKEQRRHILRWPGCPFLWFSLPTMIICLNGLFDRWASEFGRLFGTIRFRSCNAMPTQ